MLNPNVSGNIDGTKTMTELYAVNPESRQRLHMSLLLGNPFDPQFDMYRKTKNSNTREIDSLLNSMNLEVTTEPYRVDEFPEIRYMDNEELDDILDFMVVQGDDISPEAIRDYMEKNIITKEEEQEHETKS